MTDRCAAPDAMVERLEWAMAVYFSQNRQPCMSGDPRDRLGPHQRRALSDAIRAALAVIRAAFAEPSPEMVRAGAKAWGDHGNLGAVWQAMQKEALGDG